MARIPVRDYQAGIPNGQLAPLQSVEGAGALGKQIGGSLSGIAGDAFEYQTTQNLVDARLAKIERDQTLHQDLADIGLDVKSTALDAVNAQDPEASYAAGVKALQQQWTQKYGEDGDLQRRAGLIVRASGLDVRSAAIKQREQTAVGRLGNTLDTLMRTASLAGSDAERGFLLRQSDEAVDNAVANGVIREDQGVSLKQKQRAGQDELTLRRMAEQNPDSAIQALKSGLFESLDPDKRQTFVEHYTRASEADARQRQADADRQRAIEERDAAYKNNWFAVDLEHDIESGSKGPKDIAVARADGRLTPAQYDRLTKTWEAGQRAKLKGVEDQKRVAESMARVDSGAILNPKSKDDRDAVDAYFVDRAQGLEPNDLQNLIITTATRTGIIPPTIVGQMNGAARGTPERMAWGAGTFQTLDQQAPQVLDDLPDETKRTYRLASQYLNAGHAPADVQKLVQGDLQVTDQVKEQREKFVREGGDRAPSELAWTWFTGKDDRAARGDQSFWERGEQGLDNAALAAPVKAAYQREYLNEYRLTGNDEAARARAADEVKKRWYVTDVDGNRRWMQYAPELVYGGRDRSSSEWLGQQLVDQVAAASGLPADKVRGTVSLVSDPLTARAASAGTPPTYGVLRINPDTGLAEPVLSADGSPFRFQPAPRDTAALDEAAHAAEVQKLQEERTRRMSPGAYAPGAGMVQP